jgi:uncharacterized RDD family membrane protein YckC
MYCARCGKELPMGAAFCPVCGAQVQAGAPSTPSAAPVSGIDALTKDQKAQEYWVWRLVAFIVDAVIVYLVLAILTALIALPALFTGNFGFFGVVFGGIAFLWGIVFVLYFAVMESSSGASIGKRFFSLKVVSRTNSNPSLGEAFVRSISKVYWLLLLLDVIVGLATSKGYQEKYTDRLMGTKVVHL